MITITLDQIIELQKEYGITHTQNMINSGSIWGFEGSMGRFAMNMIEIGVCMLPEEPTVDYYNNRLPSRNELKDGTKGTLGNSQEFWQKVIDGDFDTIETLEANFERTETEKI